MSIRIRAEFERRVKCDFKHFRQAAVHHGPDVGEQRFSGDISLENSGSPEKFPWRTAVLQTSVLENTRPPDEYVGERPFSTQIPWRERSFSRARRRSRSPGRKTGCPGQNVVTNVGQ